MYEQEIKDNYDILINRMTKEEREEFDKKTDDDKQITLGLLYLNYSFEKEEQERLSKMSPETRRIYERRTKYDEYLSDAIKEIYERRIEKQERYSHMTKEEIYKEYLEMCDRIDRDAKERGIKTVSFEDFLNSHEGE